MLTAFFGPEAQRREVQLLADEVGLGKTFVALGVAYTVLAALRENNTLSYVSSMGNVYRAVVVITPQGNHALATKWADEVGAMVKRCGLQQDATPWFKSKRCETPEDLLIALRKASDLRRKPGSVPTVLVCEAGMFTRRIRESGAKLRFLAATLFRRYHNSLIKGVRWHIVRRAAEVRGYEDWAKYVRRGEQVYLWNFTEHERYLGLAPDDLERGYFDDWRAYEAVPFRFGEMECALDKFEGTDEGREALYSEELIPWGDEGPWGLIPYCKWVTEKNGKAELLFDGFKIRVSHLYRNLFPSLMASRLPLVIADEAHHWRRETEGCRSFTRYLAPFTHRLLLLTATPFQLCRDELEGILSRGDAMKETIGSQRVEAFQTQRGLVLKAMEKSEATGKLFSKLWGRLADDLGASFNVTESSGQMLAVESTRLTEHVSSYWESLMAEGGSQNERLQSLPGRVRPFFKAALDLKEANIQLSDVMRRFVIRHRRNTKHRRYLIGKEYPRKDGETLRPDHHQLHDARGSSLPSDAELAQYLLMKVVASATRGRRKTALGMDVTGAYSTLWSSSEGKKAVKAAAQNEDKSYFPLLRKFTVGKDYAHPKVRTMVETSLELWKRGEKALIFCFRIPTATALRDLISKEIEKQIGSARRALLHGRDASSDEAALAQFKNSLTARTGSVLPAFMDRVLLGLAQRNGWPMHPLEIQDLRTIAELAARTRVNDRLAIRDIQKPDRVLLGRICEHVLAAKYLQAQTDIDAVSREVLTRIAGPTWIETRHGVGKRELESDTDEAADVLTRSSLSASYELTNTVDQSVYRPLFRAFERSRARKAAELLDTLIGGPNLFVPLAPFQLDPDARERAQRITELLWNITIQPHGLQWEQRGEVVDAVNRTILREHFLLRLPRSVFAGGDERWSDALVRGFHSGNLFGENSESVAEKIQDFLSGLAQMTQEERSHSLRYALNAQGKAVVLVSGSTSERDAVFRGFNSPLLPEILICTQVGQEGIDLHRHCRHVVHYDLGWNPATIEQRTGRVDRIGSKTQRERKHAAGNGTEESKLPGLEIGLPYLAATYDERMFDRLYARAQAFDLLTGGDPSLDPDEAQDRSFDGICEPGKEAQFVALPLNIRDDLRVDLRARRTIDTALP